MTAPSWRGHGRLEDGEEKVAGDARIHRNAAFDEGAQADVALEDDEGAGLLFGKLLDGEQDFAERFRRAESGGEAEPALAADAREGAADLGLE